MNLHRAPHHLPRSENLSRGDSPGSPEIRRSIPVDPRKAPGRQSVPAYRRAGVLRQGDHGGV
ncbi:hypothetical protein GS506_05345 [Rhodococcus hoagii]|nr:hypothetical protein [Prescottella equi]